MFYLCRMFHVLPVLQISCSNVPVPHVSCSACAAGFMFCLCCKFHFLPVLQVSWSTCAVCFMVFLCSTRFHVFPVLQVQNEKRRLELELAEVAEARHHQLLEAKALEAELTSLRYTTNPALWVNL
jgi:hypothetical protein